MSHQGMATAVAHANIAFIKYWGVRDAALRLPWNNSISMNLSAAYTTTTVVFSPEWGEDSVTIDGALAGGRARERVVEHLDRLRARAKSTLRARVVSQNSFPAASGLASSASGFAALTMAACAALGLDLKERELSILARLASGSACRSIPGGYVEWQRGETSEESYAVSIAPAEHWDLCDVIAVVHTGEKEVSSTVGQQAASRSPLFLGRLASLPQRLAATRSAILQRDFAALAPLLEAEALSMHAIMMTSEPPIIYWQAETVILIHAVRRWRAEGLPVAFTIDAGPNVHLICPAEHVEEVIAQVRTLGCVDMMIVNHPAGPAHLVDQHLLGGAFATLRPML